MRFERFIAKRYLLSKKKVRFITIITFISIIGVSIGVGALIAVLSVFNGFNKHVTTILVGFDPHVRIESDTGNKLIDYSILLDKVKNDSKIKGVAPFTLNKGVISTTNNNVVVFIKGVDDKLIGYVSGVKDKTKIGDFIFNDNQNFGGIVLGLNLAVKLSAKINDTLTVISPAGMEKALTQFVTPKILKFIVRGIYDSDNREYDKLYAFVSIDYSQKLFNLGSFVNGLEIKLDNINDSDDKKRELIKLLGPVYKISTWYDLHQDLYSVMQIERWTAYIILSLIIAVATFNILGSLTMSVIEKKRDIGVLKTMGASKLSIMKVFLFQGVMIGLYGSIIGSILGFTICTLQIKYKLFPLDPTVYPIDALPIDMRFTDFLYISLAAFILCSVAALYPSLRAAKLQPIDAIRWE
jgi:lipoprotein-releasing system permease protein